ncbi:MAG: hypothetical protein FJX62_15545 [Alphaproteobacteria bacterium]|nr:hypothetical protein [Alphaproteobacteria bacterium]
MRRALVATAFAFIAGPALAHPPPLGIPGFLGGLLHPAFVPAHLMAIAAFGILCGQHRVAWGIADLAAFAAGLAAGLGAIAVAYAPQWAGLALLVLALTSGVLAALAKPLPPFLGLALAAMTGMAVGLDSPPDTIKVDEANRMLAGTALGAVILFAVTRELSARLVQALARPWTRVGVRVLGSWIAASAALVLAMQLSR